MGPLYARTDPTLFGFPFFFWFQFPLILIAAVLTTIAYRLSQRCDGRATRTTRVETDPMNGVAVSVFVFLFLVVTVMGFAAARWRRADLDSLDEWGLGGRGFGTFIAWFLIGGDLYTAYTFIAVPAALYAGSAVGFFAVPYTIVVYPLIFLFLPRLWSVSPPARLRHAGRLRRGPLRIAGRWRSPSRSPGSSRRCPTSRCSWSASRSVLEVMGLGGQRQLVRQGPAAVHRLRGARGLHLLLGLRAPALIAFVKDTLIYLVIIVAVIYLPHQARRLGPHLRLGRATVHDVQQRQRRRDRRRAGVAEGDHPAARRCTGPTRRWRSGSALALFMYPHSITGVLSTRKPRRDPAQRRRSCRRTPSCSGCSPCSASSRSRPASRWPEARPTRSWPCRSCSRTSSRRGSPASRSPPSRSARWCRRRSCRSRPRTCSPATSTRPSSTPTPTPRAGGPGQAKIVSLVVKFGALVFVLALSQDVRDQPPAARRRLDPADLPGDRVGLYTRWFHRWALLAGWAVGMVYGTWTAYGVSSPTQAHFGGPLASFPGTDTKVYIAARGVRDQRARGRSCSPWSCGR